MPVWYNNREHDTYIIVQVGGCEIYREERDVRGGDEEIRRR